MNKPLRIAPARAWRTYRGGSLIAALHGEAAQDTHFPEEWLMSTVAARNPGREHIVEGLSKTADGTLLRDLIEADPEGVLGRGRSGTGMLMKLIDAAERLSVQVHPTRADAQKLFRSPFGKTECWHVLSVRNDEKEAPYIRLGFKPGVTQEAFEAAYRRGDMEAIENMCHKFAVQPGETYFIPAGMPHALGEGCFVIEVQEPSDLTAVPMTQAELIRFRQECNPLGVFTPIDDALYEKQMLHSFEYTGLTLDEVFERTRTTQPVIRKGEWGEERLLIGPEQTPYFGCTMHTVDGSVQLSPTGEIRIGIVTDGEGEVVSPGGTLKVQRGSELFFPHDAQDITLKGRMTMVMCHPADAKIC